VTSEDRLINRIVLTNIKNLLLLQIYGTQAKEKIKTLARIDSSLTNLLKYFKILQVKGSLPQTLGIILICGLSIISTEKHWIPSGLMITYFYLFLQFVQNFSEVIKSASTLAFNAASARNFAQWWAEHSLDGVRNRVAPGPSQLGSQSLSEIGFQFESVEFKYGAKEPAILKGLDLSIPANSCTVIFGESGSGKSTILSLALGLHEPTSGTISIVNSTATRIPLKEAQNCLLQYVGYVGPESYLIEGTIRENLIYGLAEIPKEWEIAIALRGAECDFVEQLQGKLEHQITEQGQGLSAGQKQRLSFARALLRKPKVLILDEATSNLDLETEERLIQSIQKLKGSITIIAVTHRDALKRIADQLLELRRDK
jgi:ABC-type bacteriocin/lantibiotic exporter with double-glycine peptidase domain